MRLLWETDREATCGSGNAATVRPNRYCAAGSGAFGVPFCLRRFDIFRYPNTPEPLRVVEIAQGLMREAHACRVQRFPCPFRRLASGSVSEKQRNDHRLIQQKLLQVLSSLELQRGVGGRFELVNQFVGAVFELPVPSEAY